MSRVIYLATFELVYQAYMNESIHTKTSRIIKADTREEAHDKLLKAYPDVEYSYTYSLHDIEITEMID